MRERKKFWLAPLIIVLLLLGILIVFGGSSALAPFVYTLFKMTMQRTSRQQVQTILVILLALLMGWKWTSDLLFSIFLFYCL